MPVSEAMAAEINALNLPGWLPPHDDIVLSKIDKTYV